MSFFQRLKHWLRHFMATPAELYLARSADRYDLEFRMRQLDRGGAPFQRHTGALGARRPPPWY